MYIKVRIIFDNGEFREETIKLKTKIPTGFRVGVNYIKIYEWGING